MLPFSISTPKSCVQVCQSHRSCLGSTVDMSNVLDIAKRRFKRHLLRPVRITRCQQDHNVFSTSLPTGWTFFCGSQPIPATEEPRVSQVYAVKTVKTGEPLGAGVWGAGPSAEAVGG